MVKGLPLPWAKETQGSPAWQSWSRCVPEDWALGAVQVLSLCPAVAWGVGSRDTQPSALPGHHTCGEGAPAPFTMRGSQPPVIPPGESTTGSTLLRKNNPFLSPRCRGRTGTCGRVRTC